MACGIYPPRFPHSSQLRPWPFCSSAEAKVAVGIRHDEDPHCSAGAAPMGSFSLTTLYKVVAISTPVSWMGRQTARPVEAGRS